jgi:hypothetical protein
MLPALPFPQTGIKNQITKTRNLEAGDTKDAKILRKERKWYLRIHFSASYKT